MKTANKYIYNRVIQQNYGQGWEDVSEYESNSTYSRCSMDFSDKPSPTGKPETLLAHDVREYRLLGYATRVINRKSLNN